MEKIWNEVLNHGEKKQKTNEQQIMDNEKDLSSFINKLHNNAPNTENTQAKSR